MKNVTLAKRYARALFELATESKSVDDVIRGLGNVCHAIRTTPEMRVVLFNPLAGRQEKERLIAAVTSNRMVGKLAALLNKRHRLPMIDVVYEQLVLMADAVNGISHAVVKTPTALTDDQRRAVEKQLAQVFGGKVVGKFEVAGELIGGVWVQLGDKVLDATIKGRMDNFRQVLLNSAN